MARIRVLIVEDNPLIAEDIAGYLDDIDYDVLGIAYDYEMAIQALEHQLPDAAILDINLEGKPDGIGIGKAIREKYHIPFIYLTSYADRDTLEQIKPTRPYGYIVKPFDEKDLLSALEIALYNHAQQNIPRQLSLSGINGKINSPLTQKEFEILLELFEGRANRQIAGNQFLSVNTIKTHIRNIYDKLDVTSRPEMLVALRRLLA